MNKFEARQIREALFMSRLPVGDAPVFYRQVYERLNTEDRELILQAADTIHGKIHGIGLGGALELVSKLSILLISEGEI